MSDTDPQAPSLPNLMPNAMGCPAVEVGDDLEVEVISSGLIDINIGDGEAIRLDPGVARRLALGLMAAVQHVEAEDE